MSPWRRLSAIGRALFQRRQVEADLDDELADSIALLADRYVAAGMTADEARRAARLELGGVEQVKEEAAALAVESLTEILSEQELMRKPLRATRKADANLDEEDRAERDAQAIERRRRREQKRLR